MKVGVNPISLVASMTDFSHFCIDADASWELQPGGLFSYNDWVLYLVLTKVKQQSNVFPNFSFERWSPTTSQPILLVKKRVLVLQNRLCYMVYWVQLCMKKRIQILLMSTDTRAQLDFIYEVRILLDGSRIHIGYQYSSDTRGYVSQTYPQRKK